MEGASQGTGVFRATEEAARATFSEEAYSNLADAGSARPALLVAHQKQFKAIVSLAKWQFDGLKTAIAKWREMVQCGEVDFDDAREAGFMQELRAFSSLADFLSGTFDRFHKEASVYLSKPRLVGALVSQKKDAQKVLDSWQSPEWEVLDMRTVEYSVEQTRHLRSRLA